MAQLAELLPPTWVRIQPSAKFTEHLFTFNREKRPGMAHLNKKEFVNVIITVDPCLTEKRVDRKKNDG